MPFIVPALPLIAAVGALAGAGISAAGAMEQADATKNQMNYQAAVADMNATIDRQQANREILLGEQQAQQQGMKTRAELGGIIATQGAAGLDVRSGSNAMVQDSAATLGRFNEALVRNDAQRRSYDYLVKGFSDEASSQLYRFGARQAPIGGALTAAGDVATGIGTSSSVAARYFTPSTLGT